MVPVGNCLCYERIGQHIHYVRYPCCVLFLFKIYLEGGWKGGGNLIISKEEFLSGNSTSSFLLPHNKVCSLFFCAIFLVSDSKHDVLSFSPSHPHPTAQMSTELSLIMNPRVSETTTFNMTVQNVILFWFVMTSLNFEKLKTYI